MGHLDFWSPWSSCLLDHDLVLSLINVCCHHLPGLLGTLDSVPPHARSLFIKWKCATSCQYFNTRSCNLTALFWGVPADWFGNGQSASGFQLTVNRDEGSFPMWILWVICKPIVYSVWRVYCGPMVCPQAHCVCGNKFPPLPPDSKTEILKKLSWGWRQKNKHRGAFRSGVHSCETGNGRCVRSRARESIY